VHNVAPRRDEPSPRPGNEGEVLCAGRTAAGVVVVGPNSGHSWSFVRDELEALCVLDAPAGGSQFRSRDVLPGALARLVAGHPHVVRGRVPRDAVPDVPERVVAYVDGYGNLKTTITQPPAPTGSRVLVRVGAHAATAIVSDGAFAVAEGELALAPGSSGWPCRRGGRTRFFELFLRGASAAQRFGHPATGTPVELVTPPGG